jgi:Flp pilus assembly protein TadG
VEFALILPLMLLMLLIALDFGRLFFTYIQTANAAREASNYAAAHAVDYQAGTMTFADYNTAAVNAGLIEANIQTQAGATTPMDISAPLCFTPGSPPATIDCASAPQDGPAATGIGNQVSVTVTQQFTFLTPLIGNFFGGSLNLSATATATVLNPLVAAILAASPSPNGSPGASAPPSAVPSAAPSAAPSSAPSTGPTAAPTVCTVPDYDKQYWNQAGAPGVTATQVWAQAGFTGALSANPAVLGGAQIKNQTLQKNKSVVCTSNMTVSD